MSRIRVVVTQDDIDKGARSDGHACPIVRALHRRGFPEAIVAISYWQPYRHANPFPLSAAARGFVHDFDTHKPVKPHTFFIEGPPPALSDEV